MTESEQAESVERGETSAETLNVEPEPIDVSVRVDENIPEGTIQDQHEDTRVASAALQAPQAEHRYSKDELLLFGEKEELKHPPKDLEASGIYRELLGTLFCARSAPDGPAPDEVRLRPGGSLPVRDQEAPRPIPNGPPGVPRDSNPSSWKEQDNSWRSPFKGSPSGTQPIRSRLVDDSPPVISPPGGPPGLNMRRAAMEGPPGSGEWHPGSEGWRRAGGPQEWRGPAGPMGEEDEALSPRRHGSARVSQDMERWGSTKVPGRNESAWRPNAQPGCGVVGRGNEWNARRGRAVPPPGPGKGTPPPGFDGPPGFPTKPVAKEPRAAGGQGPEQPRNGKAAGDGKPRGLEGDWRAAKEKPAVDQDAPEGESQAERMRREFEEERQRLQEQRKKGGHTAQRAANETMGDILGDDELEEMRLRDNEEATQTGNHTEATPNKSATMPGEEQQQQQQQQQQQSKPLQPPPGFSANHLFGDVDDEDPLDLVTNLSFLNDTEEEEKPPLAKEKSSRFANFFQSETSAPGMAMGPAAVAGNAASGNSAAGQPPFQNPFPAQLGGQALLQQLQAAQHQQQGGQGPGGQQDLLAKLAQAAAAHPHLQRAVPSANARTLDDIEAAVRGSAPPGGLLKAFQQKAQGAKPGNALLSLLQGSAGPPNAAFGQDGGMPNRGEALGQAQARSDGPPQPALDPLLAHFSAMGMAQNARQNTPLPQQQQTQLGQGLGSFGGAGPNAGQQNTLASLLAGAYSQSPGQSAGMGNSGVPLHLLQQQEQLLRVRASLPGQAPVQLPGAMPMTQNLSQNFASLQQHPQQTNLGHLNQFMPQQQTRPQALNDHQQNILRLLQQQQQRQQQALQLQQQLQQQQRLAQLQAQAQQQRMTPLQALQMQLQLQQQMAGQQNFGNNANGLERFFQLNAAQRAAGLPAQGAGVTRPTHEDLEQRRFNAPH